MSQGNPDFRVLLSATQAGGKTQCSGDFTNTSAATWKRMVHRFSREKSRAARAWARCQLFRQRSLPQQGGLR